jgi:AIPR protein
MTEAREHGFNRLLNVFDLAREGWLTANIEESRPLWSLARRIQSGSLPTALRVHVVTDRPISERLREIPEELTRQGVPATFQIWDLTRLKRIHDAHSVRDDLIVDFSHLRGGGLPVLPASVDSGEYEGYLAVIPGEVLAEIYRRHGSRLLEGNVRTFLGRSGRVNKGIASTIAKEPSKFFAYNNGIATTASEVSISRKEGAPVLTSATDLQIVNGGQTTASLAAALRDASLVTGTVFVPMKISVVTPTIGMELIPQISRFANSQNSVRASDFFANHEFHRRMEEMSRRILAPGVAGSQIQTHWYYERARGQHLNDQAGMTSAQRNQFLLLNPRKQLVRKTDLAKVECCFNLEPDVACKGAEKAFTAFAEHVTNEWADEANRLVYGDEWFKAAVARVILFRAAETCISKESWYEGGYRAQIVAYTCARLVWLAMERSEGGGLDYGRIWTQQSAGPVFERQIGQIGEAMARVILKPPSGGRNISEWAKQQACRKVALEARVSAVKGFDAWLMSADQRRANMREQSRTGLIDQGFYAVKEVCRHDLDYWSSVRDFCRSKRILSPYDEKALVPVCQLPRAVPTDPQATRLLQLRQRAVVNGWKAP